MNLDERVRLIEVVVMDVDGTLTDGAMYYSVQGEELKRFNTRDGMGITLLRRGNIRPAIITSEQSEIVVKRAQKLQIADVILGSHDKTASLNELSARLSVPLNRMAYIGDDVNDIHVMKRCGLTACPVDAVSAVKQIVDVVCTARGGNGAVREFAEFILTRQGKPITLSENW